MQRESWDQTLRWQKAPDGDGEFLPYPNTPDQEEFVWGKRRFVGTRQGLLYSDAKDHWQIAPALYKQPVRVAGEGQNLLWVECGFRAGDKGLMALNHKLEVVLRLPNVKGRCIAIEPQSFWCLDDITSGPLVRSTASALLEYDLQGKEKRRFVVKQPKRGLAGPISPRKETTEDDPVTPVYATISWASVDPDAVWLSVHNYTYVETFPTPSFPLLGPGHLGRLDRGHWEIYRYPLDSSRKSECVHERRNGADVQLAPIYPMAERG